MYLCLVLNSINVHGSNLILCIKETNYINAELHVKNLSF